MISGFSSPWILTVVGAGTPLGEGTIHQPRWAYCPWEAAPSRIFAWPIGCRPHRALPRPSPHRPGFHKAREARYWEPRRPRSCHPSRGQQYWVVKRSTTAVPVCWDGVLAVALYEWDSLTPTDCNADERQRDPDGNVFRKDLSKSSRPFSFSWD